MYEKILVPTDEGEGALVAARHALDLAERYGATVHALYVIDTDTSWLTVSKTEVRDTLRDVGETEGSQALAEMESLAEEVGFEGELVTELREGAPTKEILAYAEETDIDLVVMGTHGRKVIERHLLGSVAERTLRGSSVPVMVVPDTTQDG
jgi:nucleotide-binding universal stress UspA family protein